MSKRSFDFEEAVEFYTTAEEESTTNAQQQPTKKIKRYDLCRECDTRACFGIPGSKKATHCALHKPDDYVNVINKTCEHEGCTKQPGYGVVGTKKAIYCLQHKPDDYVDVINKTCEHEGCTKQPVYGVPGSKKATHCGQHKPDGYVDVVSKKCEHEGCTTLPTYGVQGTKKAIYCLQHKPDDYVNVKDKTCQHEGCTTQPTYGVHGSKKAIYCALHKPEGYVNVVSKTCEHEGCTKQPVYGIRCSKKATHCLQHKPNDYVNVKDKTCVLCNDTRPNPKCNGHCVRCYINMFPDAPFARNYKTKENSVVNAVMSEFPNFTWKHDVRIEDGCSRRRPDLMLDLGSHVIIVEIDENQHIDYDCSCENKRMMELSQDVSHRPIVFIRFNPDDYINRNGVNITSCFKINRSTGILQISAKKSNEWNERVEILKNQIQYWIDNSSEKTLEIVQLFYDGF